ncbi:MAG TPA: TldD/PmbA family protein [Alphaproteobacteria bacterium]|nr:TldD/PmbA family protein [Alphaproteobacteria bacterium]
MAAAPSLDLLHTLVNAARKAGADAADALAVESASLSLSQRLGKPEKVERSESCDLGLRVFVGRRQAIVSSTDRSTRNLDALVERAVAMARAAPEDPYAGLADPDQIARAWPDLDLNDGDEPTAERLIGMAKVAEEAALAVDGVTNSEGAEGGWGRSTVAMAASNGFAGGYSLSRWSLGVSVLAGEGTGMERDYDYTGAVYASDLEPAEAIGRRAGERAVRRLNARKVPTCQVPVVFDPRVARGFLGTLSGAISGSAIARGVSFLKDRLGQPVFSPDVTVMDEPLLPRGLRSRPFDGEGLAVEGRAFIDRGVLTSWVLDLRSARQLGLRSTGHASRGTGGPPGPSVSNFYMQPGVVTVKELISDIKSGLYVTDMMGMGTNMVTGDYSRGAAGFWIENGELTFPVNELTVASNLHDMFRRLVPANDLNRRYGVDAPTVRIDGMTVAGR